MFEMMMERTDHTMCDKELSSHTPLSFYKLCVFSSTGLLRYLFFHISRHVQCCYLSRPCTENTNPFDYDLKKTALTFGHINERFSFHFNTKLSCAHTDPFLQRTTAKAHRKLPTGFSTLVHSNTSIFIC